MRLIRFAFSSFALPAAISVLLLPPSAVAPIARAGEAAAIEILAHLPLRDAHAGCAAYLRPDGSRYVLVGSLAGTSVVNATNLESPREVAFVPSLPSLEREVVVAGDYAYSASPALGNGIQILRLVDPEHPVLAGTYDQFFDACASLVVDRGRGLLFAVGATFQGAHHGIYVLSLENPEAPSVIGEFTAGASASGPWLGAALHGSRLYVATGLAGRVLELDVSEPTAPLEVRVWNVPGGHRPRGVAVVGDGSALYVADDAQAQPLRVFALDAPGPQLPVVASEFHLPAPLHPFETVPDRDIAYVAALAGGLRVVDVGDPARPCEFARFDPYDGPDGGIHGIYDVAPLGPGLFAASDVAGGLYLGRLRTDHGTLTMTAVDPDGVALPHAPVFLDGAEHRTQSDGSIRLAAAPGPHLLTIQEFGFEPASISLALDRGEHASFRVVLRPLPTAYVYGVVRQAPTGATMSGARVIGDGGALQTTTSAVGAYAFPEHPAGVYRLRCESDGLVPEERTISVEGGDVRTLDWSLRAASTYLSLDASVTGWSVGAPGDDAPIGAWAATDPTLVLSHEGVVLSPFGDHTQGGGRCFQTAAQGVGSEPTVTVQLGRTTLTSPPLLTGALEDPVVAFWSWFAVGVPDEPESLIVGLSTDGLNFLPIRILRGGDPSWRYSEIRIRDWLPPSVQAWIRFVASDTGGPSLATAAVDDVTVFDGAWRVEPPPEPGPAPTVDAAIRLEAPYPSPTRDAALVMLRLPSSARVRADLYDVKGRLVAPLYDGIAPSGTFAVRWNGESRSGEPAGSGVYFVRVQAPGFDRSARVVKVR